MNQLELGPIGVQYYRSSSDECFNINEFGQFLLHFPNFLLPLFN